MLCQLWKIGRDKAPPWLSPTSGHARMTPNSNLKNFQRKQAEYEAAWRATSDPQALHEALLNARGYLQLPAELDWLVTAMGDFIMKGRTKGKRRGRASQTVERFRDRMRHVRRYRCVRDLRQKDHTKEHALDLAVERLQPRRGGRAADDRGQLRPGQS